MRSRAKRGGVARDVDHAPGSSSHQRRGHALGQSTPRGVEHDDASLRHRVVDRSRRHRPLSDLQIAKSFRVLSRVAHGVGRRLDRGHSAARANGLGQGHGEQAHPAEEVRHMVIGSRVGEFERRSQARSPVRHGGTARTIAVPRKTRGHRHRRETASTARAVRREASRVRASCRAAYFGARPRTDRRHRSRVTQPLRRRARSPQTRASSAHPRSNTCRGRQSRVSAPHAVPVGRPRRRRNGVESANLGAHSSVAPPRPRSRRRRSFVGARRPARTSTTLGRQSTSAASRSRRIRRGARSDTAGSLDRDSTR